jgi:glycerophosphoryl diester phosphodiesterase
MSNLPLVIGHRGASGYAPMNTIPAFTLAADQGADGIEFDVWLSKDGVPVILHDITVDGTTDGHGKVSEMTLSELKALDAGAWKGAQYAGTRIPTLDEVFSAVGTRFTLINVEIKSEEGMVEGVEAAVYASIQRHRLAERVVVSSFDPRVLQRFGALTVDIPMGFLEWEGTPPEAYGLARLVRHEALHPHCTQVNEAYMRAAREAVRSVNTWTVNDTSEALRLRDLGVNAVITDTPDVMLRALR